MRKIKTHAGFVKIEKKFDAFRRTRAAFDHMYAGGFRILVRQKYGGIILT